MLRDNLVELIEPMLNSAGANPLALTHHQIQASGDRLPCLENPRPEGAESSLTENVTSPFQAEPAQPDLVVARPFPSAFTTIAFDYSRRRWFETCSCKPVPRGLPSSVKQLRTTQRFLLSCSWHTVVA